MTYCYKYEIAETGQIVMQLKINKLKPHVGDSVDSQPIIGRLSVVHIREDTRVDWIENPYFCNIRFRYFQRHNNGA